jgi:hypothetical protein
MPTLKSGPGETRRQFLKKAGAATAVVAGAGLLQVPYSLRGDQSDPPIALVLDPADPLTKTAHEQLFEPLSLDKPDPVAWAARQLGESLAARHLSFQFHPSLDAVSAGQTAILLAGRTSLPARQVLDAARLSLPDSPECLALARGQAQNRSVILAAGSDARGLVYALLELADRVNLCADPMAGIEGGQAGQRAPGQCGSAAFPAVQQRRGGQTVVSTTALFGRLTSTMLAANRFNRFNLTLGLGYDFATGLRDTYFYFAYPFLLPCRATTCARCRCPMPSAT